MSKRRSPGGLWEEGDVLSAIRPPELATCYSQKLGSHPPTETGDKGPGFFDDYKAKGWLSGP